MRLRGVSTTEGLDEFAARSVGLHAHLVRVVQGVTGDGAVAEEAAQEALTRLWEQLQRRSGPDDEQAWATRVALNWARSGFRRRAAERRAVARLGARPPVAPGPAGADGGDLSADLRALLLALPRRQREVAVLHYLADLDLATIARTTGSSVGSVKNALFHARRSLAAGIETANHRSSAPEAVAGERP